MKQLMVLVLACLSSTAVYAGDKEEKEQNLAKSLNALNVPTGIVDVYKDTNGQVTVYIGGHGSATASLVKISQNKAEDHAGRIADAEANRAWSEFVQKNVNAVLNVNDTITDSSINVQDLMEKMKQVTENKDLAGQMRPEDQAQIMKAIIDTVVKNIQNSSGVQSVSSLDVKTKSTQLIRGMTLFGSHAGMKSDGVVAVKIFKWSPQSANFAAEAEGINKQKAVQPNRSKTDSKQSANTPGENKPFVSQADDF